MVASKKTKKTHESINNRLALVMKSGKYTLGYKTVLKSLEAPKIVAMSSMNSLHPRREVKPGSEIMTFQVVPCAVLALCIHPTTSHNLLNRISWAFCVYLEAVSLLPQLRVMQNTKIVEPFTAHYVFALGVARTKLFVVCEPGTQHMEALFKVVYELYTDYVLKNPFYEMEMPIRFGLFDINLTQAVQKDRVALLGR